MATNEQKNVGIKAPVKKISKEITKSHIQKIIKELTHRSLKEKIKKLKPNEIQKIEQKLSNLSEQEKIEHFSDSIDEITRKITQGGIEDTELIQEISLELETKIAYYFPQPPPSILDRIYKWFRVHLHSILIVISIFIVSIAFFALPNSIPEAHINSTVPKAPIYLGTQMDLSGYGTVRDKNDVITDYQWISNLDGILSRSGILNMSMLSAGKHNLTFKVKDNHNQWSEPVYIDLEIIANHPPTAHIDNINPEKVFTGTPITFSGHGEDIDVKDTITSYEWSLNGNILSTENTFVIPGLSPGVNTIRFRVKDNNEIWSETADYKINIAQPPIAYIDSILPSTILYTGTPMTFLGHGVDPDKNDPIMSYEWSLNNTILSISQNFTSQDLPVGTLMIQFRVRDNYGEWSKPDVKEIEILNHQPVALIDSIAPKSSFFGTQLTFLGHGEDQDNNDFISSYEWSINNIKISSSNIFSSNSIPAGNRSVMLRVMDSHGAWSAPAYSNIEIIPYTPFNVFSEKGLIVSNGLCNNGLKNCRALNNISGGEYYAKVGGRVAINGNPNKLAEILIEQGVADKTVLIVGQTWDIGGGYTLTIQSIDAQSNPKRAWLVLSKDGVKLDDRMVNQGEVYVYSKKSLASESDVPVFVTYIDSVIPGKLDSVQLRYTWAISDMVTIIN